MVCDTWVSDAKILSSTNRLPGFDGSRPVAVNVEDLDVDSSPASRAPDEYAAKAWIVPVRKRLSNDVAIDWGMDCLSWYCNKVNSLV